ncbi:MAG: hypothetical protein U0136_19685 [Bdellovibrionota bacterium]
MTNSETFLGIAIFGTTLFLGRSALVFFGFGDHHGDVYHDSDTPSGTETSFRLLSLQTFTAFMMTFGWAGLAALEEFESTPAAAFLIAFGVGSACLLLTACLAKSIRSMATTGEIYSLNDLIGKRTSVYQRIPADGIGRIQASVGGVFQEVKAVSAEHTEIDSFKLVEVVQVLDGETVSVKQVNV